MVKKFILKTKILAPILLTILFGLLIIVVYYLLNKTKCNCNERFSEQYLLEIYTAPWCGHCKKMEESGSIQSVKDTLDKGVVKHYQDGEDDCKVNMDKHKLNGYPSIILTKNGIKEKTYEGDRSPDDICDFYTQNSQ